MTHSLNSLQLASHCGSSLRGIDNMRLEIQLELFALLVQPELSQSLTSDGKPPSPGPPVVPSDKVFGVSLEGPNTF